jgi:molybdenum cofactor cytidylyltransferase
MILAAGLSRRMGAVNKLLIEFKGKSVLRHAVDNTLAASFWETIVVIGPEPDKIGQEVNNLAERCVLNPDYKEGIASSIRAGIKEVSPQCQGTIILLADMPAVRPVTLKRFQSLFVSGSNIVAAKSEDYIGVPVLFHRRFFADLQSLRGDQGAKTLLKRYAAQITTLDVPAKELLDIDEPADLEPYSQSG